MTIAYVDSSCVVALLFGETGAASLRRRLRSFDTVLTSHLLEAEVRAAAARENVRLDPAAFHGIRWVQPDRPLSPELERVFATGRLRGADAWHVACALYLGLPAADVSFLTLDEPQGRIAEALGFVR